MNKKFMVINGIFCQRDIMDYPNLSFYSKIILNLLLHCSNYLAIGRLLKAFPEDHVEGGLNETIVHDALLELEKKGFVVNTYFTFKHPICLMTDLVKETFDVGLNDYFHRSFEYWNEWAKKERKNQRKMIN